MENLSKNLSDADEYPAMMHIHQRCISMLSHLWRIPKGETAIGTATTGSSEAIHLGGMAMKRRWVERRQKAGKGFLSRDSIPQKKKEYISLFSAIRVGKCLELLAP